MILPFLEWVSWRKNKMKKEQAAIIYQLNAELPIALPASTTPGEMRDRLAVYINNLITTNFEKLLFYLYRIDVDEKKMRAILQKHKDKDAGVLVADLVIERLTQKIMSRQHFNSRNNDIAEEDKW